MEVSKGMIKQYSAQVYVRATQCKTPNFISVKLCPEQPRVEFN